MVQRLSVAQAMIGSPSLLILDEPMIGIDPAGVVHFRSLFRDFVDGGGTIIMSSHIMSEVESLCSSLVVIHSGQMIYRGPIAGFIDRSLTSRTIQIELAPASPEALVTSVVTSILKIPGVTGVIRSGVGGGAGLIADVEKGRDVRGEISRVVVESGAALLSIGYSRSELDDAYVASVRGSGVTVGVAAAGRPGEVGGSRA